MDDFTPYGHELQEDLFNLCKVLNKCIEMNFSLNPKKFEFLRNVGTILGHSISKDRIQVDPKNVSIIKRVSNPKKQRDVRRFLRLVGYYKSFIKDFSKLASHLFRLLAKDSNFHWKDKCQYAFEVLKETLTIVSILTSPN